MRNFVVRTCAPTYMHLYFFLSPYDLCRLRLGRPAKSPWHAKSPWQTMLRGWHFQSMEDRFQMLRGRHFQSMWAIWAVAMSHNSANCRGRHFQSMCTIVAIAMCPMKLLAMHSIQRWHLKSALGSDGRTGAELARRNARLVANSLWMVLDALCR